MIPEFDTIEFDNNVKIEKYYNAGKARHYLQLLEIAESIVRSPNVTEKAAVVAKGFANHYRRMVICIVMKPFNPDETHDIELWQKYYMFEVNRLNKLLDPENPDLKDKTP